MSVKSPFPHPWVESYTTAKIDPCRPIDEWHIINISNSIREKNNWIVKYKDPIISSNWKKEIKNSLKGKHVDEIIEYVFRELQWYEKLQQETGSLFYPGCDDRIFYGDKIVPYSLRSKFMSEAEKLEKNEEKDYHPDSNNQVIDLVHPSLYPLRYDITPVYTDDGKLDISKMTPELYDEIREIKRAISYGLSKKFQWLPSSFALKDGEFKIDSYINNLNPEKYQDLYTSIEAIFNHSIPGLNAVLSRTQSECISRINIPYDTYCTQEYYDKGQYILDHDDKFQEDAYNALEGSRHLYAKEYPPIYEEDPITKKFDIRDFERLKVITKMANIELTPENPKYKGGSWHVEGTANEDIIATIIYYYDSENITESNLSFRCTFSEPMYEQNDDFYLENYFGLKDETQLNRYLGRVASKTERMLIFPNILQHHVDEFELEDPTEDGHRKILCFFLVDPYNDLVKTTKEVPPQQKTWWDAGKDFVEEGTKQKIMQLIKDWPRGMEEAKQVRIELMAERSAEFSENNDSFERYFSLCEH